MLYTASGYSMQYALQSQRFICKRKQKFSAKQRHRAIVAHCMQTEMHCDTLEFRLWCASGKYLAARSKWWHEKKTMHKKKQVFEMWFYCFAKCRRMAGNAYMFKATELKDCVYQSRRCIWDLHVLAVLLYAWSHMCHCELWTAFMRVFIKQRSAHNLSRNLASA